MKVQTATSNHMTETQTTEKAETKAAVKSRLQISIPPSVERRLNLLAEAQSLPVAEVGTRALTEWVEANYWEQVAFWSSDLT